MRARRGSRRDTRDDDVPSIDLTAVIVAADDEERIGHTANRIGAHLRSLGLRFEILVVDEGSIDNTLALASLLRRSWPELEVMSSSAGLGFYEGAQRARGRAVMLYDARTDATLAALGFGLGRLDAGLDVHAVSGRYLLMRRTRSWRTFDALAGVTRDPLDVERRVLRRARHLGLRCQTAATRRATSWARLRRSFLPSFAFSRGH